VQQAPRRPLGFEYRLERLGHLKDLVTREAMGLDVPDQCRFPRWLKHYWTRCGLWEIRRCFVPLSSHHLPAKAAVFHWDLRIHDMEVLEFAERVQVQVHSGVLQVDIALDN